MASNTKAGSKLGHHVCTPPKFLQEAPAILARRHSFPVRSPLVTKGSIGIIVKLSKPMIYDELVEEADEFNEEQEEEQQQLKQQQR